MKKSSESLLPNEELAISLTNNSSDEDSDPKRLFELPKRKIIRPPTLAFKKKFIKTSCWLKCSNCCETCAAFILPILLAVFIVAMLLCITYLVMGLSGLKNDVQILKIKVSNMQDSVDSSIARREKLVQTLEGKLEAIQVHHTSLTILENRIVTLRDEFFLLNSTVYKILKHPSLHLPVKLTTFINDIDTLKTGMAHTGAEIEELRGNDKILGKDIINIEKSVADMHEVLFNATVSLSELENKPRPGLFTTLKTLVVTMQPDEELPVKRKELAEKLTQFKIEQRQLCTRESEKYYKNFMQFVNDTQDVTTTHTQEIDELKRQILTVLQSKTEDDSQTNVVTFPSSTIKFKDTNTSSNDQPTDGAVLLKTENSTVVTSSQKLLYEPATDKVTVSPDGTSSTVTSFSTASASSTLTIKTPLSQQMYNIMPTSPTARPESSKVNNLAENTLKTVKKTGSADSFDFNEESPSSLSDREHTNPSEKRTLDGLTSSELKEILEKLRRNKQRSSNNHYNDFMDDSDKWA